jgi:hypothetical protein
MKALWLGIVGAAAFASLPANAHDRHFRVYPRTVVSIDYGYPFGFGYYRPYRYYPYGYGVGVHIGNRYPIRRSRTERTGGAQRALKLYVYPAAGQSEAQLAEDRYQCHVWAADESGHDPTLGAGTRDDAQDYTRAFTACMEARDYVVK